MRTPANWEYYVQARDLEAKYEALRDAHEAMPFWVEGKFGKVGLGTA